MKWCLTFFFSFSVTISYAQPGVIFTNAQKVDDDRYEDYDGNPYQFKNWYLVNIYDASGLAFEKLEFNINGFSNEIEIRKEGRFIELDQIAYTRIESVDEVQKFVFKRGIDGMFKEKFVEVLYEGNQYKLVRKFITAVTEKEFNDVGKTIQIKRFEPKFKYFIIRDGKMDEVKLKKKQILNYLGNKKLIESYSSKNKLKLNNPFHLVKILEHLEDQN